MPTLQQRGGPGIAAIPGKRFGAPRPNKANQLVVGAKPFRSVGGILSMMLSGTSRDSAGVALGNCQVLIFRTADKSFVAETTSDANGAWSVEMMKGGPFFLVEYLAGTPDVAGTSVNTVVPAAI